MAAVLGLVLWAGLGLLPVYLASKRDPYAVPFWWLAAVLLGPLAGIAYLLARRGTASGGRHSATLRRGTLQPRQRTEGRCGYLVSGQNQPPVRSSTGRLHWLSAGLLVPS